MNLKNCCCNLKTSPFSVSPEISLLQLSNSSIWCLKNTTDAPGVNKLRIIDSIYSLLFTTVVGDDKLEMITLKNILSRRSWKLNSAFKLQQTYYFCIEEHYVYNFHRSWMADNNKFMFLVAKLSFILISTIINSFSCTSNLLSINKSFQLSIDKTK